MRKPVRREDPEPGSDRRRPANGGGDGAVEVGDLDDAAPQAELSGSLTKRAMSGFLWTAVGAGGHAVLHLVILAVLARLLTPEDFGLVAVAMLAVSFTSITAQSGIGNAIVQRRTLEEVHLRVGLTISVSLHILLWAVLVSVSGLIERAFAIDGVAPIVAVVSVSFVIRSLTLGDYVLFRALAFRKVATVDLISYGLGYGVVAITMALQGVGAWAIVMGHLGFAAVRTILLWILAPHPAWPLFRRDVARELLSYGGGHTLGRLANWLGRQGDYLIVGRFLGAAALGLYGRAYQLMATPAKLFGEVADRVLFSSMAKIQDDQERVGRAYRRGVALIALMALPASAFMAIVADELIMIFLGEDWLGLRAAFDVLVFGILFRTSYKLSDALAIAIGAVYRHAWRQGVYATAILVGALVGQAWGLTGVAIGVTLGITANFLLMAQLSLKLTGLSWRAFAGAHVSGVVAAGVTAAATMPAAMALRTLDSPAVVVVGGAGVCAALAMLVAVRASASLNAETGPAALLRGLRSGLSPRLAGVLDKIVPPPESTRGWRRDGGNGRGAQPSMLARRNGRNS